MTSMAKAETAGRLRREYFFQDEIIFGPPRPPARRQMHTRPVGRRGFTLGGHPLSSLYRGAMIACSQLTTGNRDRVSSWEKYSNTAPAKGTDRGNSNT